MQIRQRRVINVSSGTLERVDVIPFVFTFVVAERKTIKTKMQKMKQRKRLRVNEKLEIILSL